MKKDPRLGILLFALGIIAAITLHVVWGVYNEMSYNLSTQVIAVIIGAVLSFLGLANKDSIFSIVHLYLQMFMLGTVIASAMICLAIKSPDWTFSYAMLGYCAGIIAALCYNPRLRRYSHTNIPTDSGSIDEFN